MNADVVTTEVEGRGLTLSNLGKVLYPEAGFTKGEVLDYYARVAPVLLPHVEGRPLTFKRYPDGVSGQSFFAKRIPARTPEWVHTVELPSPHSTKGRATAEHAILCDLPTLVWAANLATLELHVPQWRVDGRGRRCPPDRMVFDLDPGAPADIVGCCRVALRVRDALAEDGLQAYPKTSGAKGLHIHVPLQPGPPWEDVHAYGRRLAERLEAEHPELVLARMARRERRGKVFIDWSQNNQAKTTVAPYSLRARAYPTVSTPLAWEEVEECLEVGDPVLLRFLADDVLDRVAERGDLFRGMLLSPRPLPSRPR